MDLLGPALGLLELESIAKGVVIVDALVKKARVRVFTAEAVTPGKFLLMFSGEVAEVEESFRAGELLGGPMVIDRLLLPQLAQGVRLALSGKAEPKRAGDSIGIVETHTVASTVLAADTAVKRAKVRLTQLNLAKGIGGKGWFTLAGDQHDVEAALDGAGAAIAANLLVATELIARPHSDVPKSVF